MTRKKHRGNGDGSIYQRPNGRWCGQSVVAYDANGKAVRRTVSGETRRDVQEKLTRLQADKLNGTLADSGKMTVAQFLDRWLQDAAKPSVSDGTYANYERSIRREIKPRIGHVLLSKLTPLNVQGLYSAMEREGNSSEKRRLVHIVLQLALKRAVRWGLIPRNVCQAVEPPRLTAKSNFKTLTKEQVRSLLKEAAGNRVEAIFVLAVTTGMRLGELLGLEWSNVNLDAGYVQVKTVLSEVNGKLKTKEPKTKSSRRRIDLPARAIEALRQHRQRMISEGFGDSPFVFTNEHGEWWRRSHFHDQSFKPLLKRAGLPAIRFHDLRHTSATLLLTDNVHPKVVQERMGHSKIGTTLDTYSHVVPTMQREAAEKFDEMFGV
jgi:integrase